MLARLILSFGIFLLGMFFGGTREMSYIPVFCVFCLAFIFVLAANGGFRCNLLKLSRFAPFWIGLALAVYIVVQILNPWLEFIHMDGYSAPRILDCFEFLPTSVFSADSSVDSYYASIIAVLLALVFSCALHIEISSREDCIYYAKVFFAVSTILGACAICDSIFFRDSVYIWGIMDQSAGQHYGSFVYKNQCGAFLLMGLICGISLCLSSMRFGHSIAKLTVYGIGIAINVASIFISRSVGSIIFCVLILIVSVFVAAIRFQSLNLKISALAIVSIPVLALSLLLFYLGHSSVMASFERLDNFISGEADFDKKVRDLAGDRGKFKEIATEFILTGGDWKNSSPKNVSIQRIILGSGATSFGKIMRLRGAGDSYFHSKVYSSSLKPSAAITVPVHVHCDILEAVFEFGLAWLLTFIAMSVYFIKRMVRAKFWRSSFLSIQCAGILLILIYSSSDIIFYNMFLFAAFCGLATIVFDYACIISGCGTPLLQRHLRVSDSAQ